MPINAPGFLEKQVEKLNNSKNGESPKLTVVKEEVKAPVVIENGIKDATKELANKDDKSLATATQEAKPADGVENKEEDPKADVPSQKRVDLDKNKEKKESQEKKVKKDIDQELKNHLSWLEEEDKEEKPAAPDYENEVKQYKSKVQEYEGLLNDDYIKAVVEFRKNGGTDLNDLSKQLGITDPNRITIEDFYTQKAEASGLKGEELTEAVNEAVERYKGLPKLDQADILNTFKNTLKNKTEEKLKSFSVQNQTHRQQQEQVQNNAIVELQKEVNEKIGKKWRGLLIDEKMGKEILQAAPNYTFPQKDENGKITGYDSKHGVEMAIYAKFGKKLLKAQVDIAKVLIYDEAIQERNRPSENMTSNQIVVTAPNDIERINKEIREEKKLKLGIGKK